MFTRDGNYIYFGLYPQTVKANDVMVNNGSSSMVTPNFYTSANAEDKVFFLSDKEAANAEYGVSTFSDYSYGDPARRKVTSDYSRAVGAYTYMGKVEGTEEYYGKGSWYLRTPSSDDARDVRYVDFFGSMASDWSDSNSIGIVPAMQINIK